MAQTGVGETGAGEGADERRQAGASVRLRGVNKVYGRFTAVQALDLDVRAGEFITFLGPSGSGKSTTLMMIAGFETPSAGDIHIGDRPVVRVPPNRRNIGMVFQNYALFPHMTVADNVAFALRQRGIARDEIARRVTAALEMVQLQGLEQRFPQQLSGGQQQRVAIARATVFNPPVLLMDEPLSALDKQLREGLLLEIKHLHANLGITFIYVTHDQREALVMSDRVVVMNHGRIEQVDSPRALYDRPTNRFVASFVGEANFFPVREARVFDADCTGFAAAGASLRAPGAMAGASECMVRPEKIAVRKEPSARPDHNAVRATLREAVFMGDSVRYVLGTRTGESFVAKQPHRAGTTVPDTGDSVVAEWAVDDTRLL